MFGLFGKKQAHMRDNESPVKKDFTPPGPEVKTTKWWVELEHNLREKGLSEKQRWKEKEKYMPPKPRGKIYYYYFDIYPTKESRATVRVISKKAKDLRRFMKNLEASLGERVVYWNDEVERHFNCNLRNIQRFDMGQVITGEAINAVVMNEFSRTGVIFSYGYEYVAYWSSSEWDRQSRNRPVIKKHLR